MHVSVVQQLDIVYLCWSEPHEEKVEQVQECEDKAVEFPGHWVTTVEPGKRGEEEEVVWEGVLHDVA